MNSDPKSRLNRIIALARDGHPAPAEASLPPLGFATRVAARWAAGPPRRRAVDVWERISWWGSGIATATCLLALTFQSAEPEPTSFDLLLGAPLIEQPF